MSVQNSNLTSNLASQLLQIIIELHLIAFCVEKSNLNISNIIEDGLLGNYLVITVKTIILQRNVCLSENEVFR